MTALLCNRYYKHNLLQPTMCNSHGNFCLSVRKGILIGQNWSIILQIYVRRLKERGGITPVLQVTKIYLHHRQPIMQSPNRTIQTHAELFSSLCSSTSSCASSSSSHRRSLYRSRCRFPTSASASSSPSSSSFCASFSTCPATPSRGAR
jgi:hypothetical protein